MIAERNNSGLFLKRRFFRAALIVFYAAVCVCAPLSVQAQESIKTLCDLGQKAFEEQKYQEAIDYFEKAIGIDNNFSPAYHALGLIYQQISPDPAYPLWYFETALKINPDFAPSMDMLCRAYYQMQDYDAAEKMCLKVLEKNPDLTGSQLSLAWTYLLGRSDADKAIYYFEKVQKKITAAAVDLGLGMSYAIRGNHGDHGKVLDAITRLRAQRMEEFAAHLEAMLRSQTDAEEFMPANFRRRQEEIEQKQAEQLEQMQAAQEAQQSAEGRQIVPVPVVVRPKITESPQVRIQGKIRPPQVTGVSGYSQPKTYGGQDGKHPGSLEDW